MVDVAQEQDLIYEIPDFSSGMVSVVPFSKSPRNSLRWAEGCLVDDGGSLVPRHGFNTELGTLSTSVGVNDRAVIGMIAAGEGSEKKLYVMVHDSTAGDLNVFAWNGSTWLSDTGVSLTGAPTSGSVANTQAAWARHSNGNEYVFWANPYGNSGGTLITPMASSPITTDWGNGTDDPPANARLVLWFRDRLWMAGIDGEFRDYLYFSKLLAPESTQWDHSTQIIRFGGTRGERITAIHPFVDNLMFVGTEHSLYLLAVGASAQLLDWDLRTITNSIGVGASMSVVSGGGDVFFVDDCGETRSLKKTLGDIHAGRDLDPISLRITEQSRFIAPTSAATGVQSSVAYFLDGHYWIWGSEGAYNGAKQVGWSFNAKRGIWTGPHYLKKDAYTSASDPLGGTIGTADREDPEDLVGTFDFDPITAAVATQNDFGTSDSAWVTGKTTTVIIAAHGTKTNSAIDSAWDDQSILVYDQNPSGFDRVDYDSTGVAFDIKTQMLDFGFPDRDKIVKWVEIEWGSESVTTAMDEQKYRLLGRTDPSGLWTPLADVTSTDNLGRTKTNVRILGKSRLFQFRVARQDTTVQGLRINSMRMSVEVSEVQDI
jgi:hypothetical protein